MKLFRLSILLLTLGSLSVGLYAGGFALSGVGSRATAMGGAFRGLADDPSAMYWNPAGLGFMDENSASLGGTFIMPSAKWVNNTPYFSSVPGYTIQEYKAKKSLKAFPNAFITMAKSPKLKYGLGIFVPYGLGTTWDAYQQPAVYAGFTDFPEEEMKSSIAIVDFHPSVAYQIKPNLSAGMGISVLYGNIGIAKIQFSDPPNYLPTTSDLSGSGIGFGANIGVIYKPMDGLSVGLTGKLPSSIKMNGDIEAYTWVPPATKVGGTSDIETTLKLPADIGIGFSYQVMPQLTVNLDYAYTMWSRLDKVVVDLDTPITISPIPGAPQLTSSELVFDWKDTHRISIGGEYRMGCNDLRLGFYFDQSPIPDETLVPTISDVNNKISSNIGWGRIFGKIGVDANFQYVIFTERDIETQTTTNMAGTYNAGSISGNIGLSYKF